MKRSTPLPELLAPAGSPDALVAAVHAGADAVYLGGRHSARAFAANFDEAALAEAVRYAHLFGVRVYIALNTLLLDRELPDLLPYADRVAATGVDAAIVADLGLMSLLSRHLPELPLHASTQAFIHNTATADFYAARGATRVVAARELSLPSLTSMVTGAKAEVEVFLHGALCVSHSGQCLFSSLVGGRSGNRGECAQPCRLPYGGRYPLSLSDLSLSAHIPALIASGVASLKIEGRMKSPTYVAGVTAIYRRLLDEGRAANREEQEELARLFSRSGFTDGYFTDRKESRMTGIRTAENKEESRKCEGNFTKKSAVVTGSAVLRRGMPARLSLTLGGRTVTVTGDTPLEAERAPLTREEVTARLFRLGGTDLVMKEGGLALTMDEGIFLPVSSLNALRRAAVHALCDTTRAVVGAVYVPPPRPALGGPHRVAVCHTAAAHEVAAREAFFDRTYLSLAELPHAKRTPEGILMPPVITDGEWAEVEGMLKAAAEAGVGFAMCESYGQIAAVRRAGLVPVGGFRLNITNRPSAAALLAEGVDDLTLSPELSAKQAAAIGGRLIVYGRIPLMLTERCFVKENFGCRQCGSAALTDRRGVRFPLLREYPHRMLVLNSLPTYLADRPALLCEAGNPRELYLFTNETEKECAAVIAAAREGLPLASEVRRLPK